MTTTHKYLYEQDPGHGWLVVPMEEIKRLGIADRITPYSYRHGDTAYLEEDLDMTVFIDAKTKAGEPIERVSRYVQTTPIRNYRPYWSD